MSPSKRPGSELLEKVDKILASQVREEHETSAARNEIKVLNGQVSELKGEVRTVTTRLDGITKDLGGEGGEPRMRERVVRIEDRLDGHDEDIEEIREQGKTEKANRWALWLTVLGALLLTAVTAIVKYLAQ